MALSNRLREHIRHNLWGIVAVFIALGGTAAALPGKNQVDSGDIKNANVKLNDLATNSVDGSKVVDNALKGADVDEASLDIPQQAIPSSLPPSGAAGGDLNGTYPDPQVQESGLTTGGDLSGTLANAQVGEAGLVPGGDLSGTLANAQVGEAGLVPGGDLGGTLANAQVSEGGLTAAGDVTGALNATAIASNSLGVQEPGTAANDEIVDQGVDTEDVRNNDLVTGDIAADTLTDADISNSDTIADQELDDVVRRISIPASEFGDSALAGGSDPVATLVGDTPAFAFSATADNFVELVVPLPTDRVAGTGLDVTIYWSANSSASQRAAWRFHFRALEPEVDEVDDPLIGGASVAALPGSANELNAVTFGTVGDSIDDAFLPGSGGLLTLRVTREGSLSVDDLPVTAALHMVEVSYTAER